MWTSTLERLDSGGVKTKKPYHAMGMWDFCTLPSRTYRETSAHTIPHKPLQRTNKLSRRLTTPSLLVHSFLCLAASQVNTSRLRHANTVGVE